MLVLPLQGKRTHSLLIIGFVIFETEKRKGRGGEGREERSPGREWCGDDRGGHSGEKGPDSCSAAFTKTDSRLNVKKIKR